MTVCNPTDDRCDSGSAVVGSGILEDPDTAQPEPMLCSTVPVDADLLGLLNNDLDGDPLHGLGGLDYIVSLEIGAEDEDPSVDLFAEKSLQVAPRIPMGRMANNNPYLDHIDATVDMADPVPLPLGRCVDQAMPLTVAPEAKVRLDPIEPDGVRETYVVPTLDGKSRTFTESLTYQWVSSGGGFSDGNTGGPHDAFGNPAPLFTDWTAPKASDLMGLTSYSIWIVQRDERRGERWYESCIAVQP
jgi:hypothetical protein